MTCEEMSAELSGEIRKTFPEILMVAAKPVDLIFEERVLQNCFYCGRYNGNWRCPPKLPDVNYPQMMNEFENGAFVYLRLPFTDENYKEVREKSSVRLHRAVLALERLLWERNYPMALSFIGGSCKLCKNGCGKEKCNNPYHSRSPIEATGVNIIASAQKYGIQITFPEPGTITRIGFLLW